MIWDRFLFWCSKDKTASFVITLAHIWNSELSKCSSYWNSTFFFRSLYDFLSCVMFSSHSNPENHSCNFMKFCESATNMMRICLLWAWANRTLRDLVLNFGGLDMPLHIGKLGSIHATELSNSVLKMVISMPSESSHFCLPLHLSFQNVCKVQYMW